MSKRIERALSSPWILIVGATALLVVMAARSRTDGVTSRWEQVAVPLITVVLMAGLYVSGYDGDAETRLATVGETAVLSGIVLVGLPSALHGGLVQFPEIYLDIQQNDTVLFTTLFGVLISAVGFAALGLAGRTDPDVPAWVWGTLCSLGPVWPVLLWATIVVDAPARLSTTAVQPAVVAPVAVGLLVIGVQALLAPLARRPT